MKIWDKINLEKLQYLLLLLVILLVSACGGGKMSQQEQQDYEELVQMVISDSREFEIVNQWANPQRGSNVNIIGNTNFIRFEGDSVKVFLPYFGERYSGGNYGSGGGISYEGPLQDLKIEERRDKQQVLLSFEGEDDNEEIKFFITLYSNGRTNTSITTPQRSSISYKGELQD